MRLSELCIDRPVLSMVISFVLLVAGLVSFYELEIRYFPKVFQPSLVVSALYGGASASVVEDTLTRPLEEALSNTPDLDYMSSQSSPGASRIQLHFNQITQSEFVMDLAKIEEEVSSVMLPNGVRTPEVSPRNDNGAQVAVLGVTNPHYMTYELADYAKNRLIPSLTRIPGVSGVDLWGVESALRISLHPLAMNRLGLKIEDVITTLESNNVSVASGNIISKEQQISINTNSLLPSIESFNNLPLAYKEGRLIHLSDVAEVALGPDTLQAGQFYIDGKPGVALSINTSEDANPITVSRAIQKWVATSKNSFPPGMTITVPFDMGAPLADSMKEVVFTIIEAVVLVALIILIFLGDFRAMLIPTVTIPVCLIASCLILLMLHYSLNIFTLLASVLAVGLVVDDAIVVLENIHRHREAGLIPIEAAKRGSREITFAVIGMTLCLIAIYLPSAFIQGRVGSYYREFSFTLASAVAFSGLLALTLSPMMCSRLLSYAPSKELTGYARRVNQFFETTKKYYGDWLIKSIRFRYLFLLAFLGLIGLGVFMFKTLPSETLPPSKAEYITAFGDAPNTASASYTFAQFDSIMSKIRGMPDYQTSLEGAGFPMDSNREGFAWIRMKAYEDRKEKNIDVLADTMNTFFKQNSALDGGAFVYNLNSQNDQGSPGSLSFNLLGFEDYKTLNDYTDLVVQALRKDPLIQDASNNHAFDNQQYELTVNRELASQLGVPLTSINQTIQIMLNGYTLNSQYEVAGLSYSIIVQLPAKNLADFHFLDRLFVHSLTGEVYPLSRLVTVKPVVDMYMRNRVNQLRAMQIYVTPQANAPLSEVISHITATARELLPSTVQINLTGEARKLQKSNLGLYAAFGLGVLFVYLILAALFESFIDPLIILLTVPMCVVGALVALKLEGGSFNMYTGIGLVTLIGLVSKHGVLITQFTNELRSQGSSLEEALVKACGVRLRPILMTTSTMVLGALPLLVSHGAGSEGRIQLGWVIVAGLLLGTVFSLWIVPLSYYFLSGLKRT
jgi:multidrug efflux pump